MTISPSVVRANGSSLRGYLAVFRGTEVLSATVTADAALLSETSLSISITSGSIANVQRGYRVVFESSGGDFKGQSSIRWGTTLDSTHLPVREFSQSEFLILATDVVKVYALIDFVDKLVEASDLFDPDGVPVGVYNSAPPPLACSGGYDAGFVDGYETGTPLTYRTQVTNGAPSLILDPTSTPGNLAHLWTLPAGVTFAPGSASTNVSPTLRVTVGEYTVYHDVTDNDNGQTWRQCVTYQCYDAAHLPVSVVMETAPTGDVANGWSCTFRAVNLLSLTDAPDGALVLFFVRERINGAWQSLGGTAGRSASKVVGYLSHDESELTPPLQYQRFEVISPLARLAQLPGFSKILQQSETPDDWSKVLALMTTRAMIQLLRVYNFALDGGHDLLISPYLLDFPYPELWLQKESPRQQVDELADGVDGRLTCTRSGLFRLDPVAALTDAATRALLNVAYTFSRRDVARLVARRDHLDTVGTLELHATSGTGTGHPDDSLPYFSRAPGSPGHGAEFITIERIIVTGTASQDSTNERAGQRYGLRNRVCTGAADGIKRRAPEVDLEMRQVYDFLDFDDQIVHFDSFPNPRDVDLTAFNWTLTKVSLDYASGKVISTFAALTDSPPGETYIPPASSVVIPIQPPLVLPIAQPARLIPYTHDIAPTDLIIFDAGSPTCHVATTLNLSTGAPIYVDASTGLTGVTLHVRADPWNYGRYFALQTTGLYRNDSPFTGGSWSLVANYATMFGDASATPNQIEMSINRRGYIGIAGGLNGFAYSFDLGATWHQSARDGGVIDFQHGIGKFGLSPFNNGAEGWLRSSIYGTTASYKSTNWGATWTLITPFSDPGDWNIPYIQSDGVTPNINNAGQQFYINTGQNAGGLFLEGPDFTAHWEAHLSGATGPQYSNYGSNVQSFTWDSSVILAVSSNNSLCIIFDLSLMGDNTTAGAYVVPNLFGGADRANIGVNGYSNYKYARLLWCRETATFYWGFTEDNAMTAVAAPGGYTGVSYAEWSLRSLIPPSA